MKERIWKIEETISAGLEAIVDGVGADGSDEINVEETFSARVAAELARPQKPFLTRQSAFLPRHHHPSLEILKKICNIISPHDSYGTPKPDRLVPIKKSSWKKSNIWSQTRLYKTCCIHFLGTKLANKPL